MVQLVDVPGGSAAGDQNGLEHEVKFVLPASRADLALQWLRLLCVPDRKYPTGLVSSIYYDTPGMRLLGEKVNSDYLKLKVRLRWYGDPVTGLQSGSAFLEAKYRVGGLRRKVRIHAPHDAAELSRMRLDDGRLRSIPSLLLAHGAPIPPSLRPIMMIRYSRYRFRHAVSNARISLDTDMTVPAVNRQALHRSGPAYVPGAILEVKGEGTELPRPLAMLARLGGRKTSFSKYSAAYHELMRSAS